jgi:hypothetical protein
VTEYTKPTIYYPVKIESDTFDGYLQCPVCDSLYIHQYETNIYYRSEDDDRCMVTSAQYGRSYTVERDNAGNPSVRRDGLTIAFWCESCDGGADQGDCAKELCIAQHKGLTLMSWRCTSRSFRRADAPFDPRGEQVIFEEDPS